MLLGLAVLIGRTRIKEARNPGNIRANQSPTGLWAHSKVSGNLLLLQSKADT